MGLSPILSVIQPVTTDTMLNNNGRITKDMFSQASVILSLNGVNYHVKGQPTPSPRQSERSPPPRPGSKVNHFPPARAKGQPLTPGQDQRSTPSPPSQGQRSTTSSILDNPLPWTTPPPHITTTGATVNVRAVRILLECILATWLI